MTQFFLLINKVCARPCMHIHTRCHMGKQNKTKLLIGDTLINPKQRVVVHHEGHPRERQRICHQLLVLALRYLWTGCGSRVCCVYRAPWARSGKTTNESEVFLYFACFGKVGCYGRCTWRMCLCMPACVRKRQRKEVIFVCGLFGVSYVYEMYVTHTCLRY